jgi:hypothetical protein
MSVRDALHVLADAVADALDAKLQPPPAVLTEEFITPQAAARESSYTDRAIVRWCNAGAIPGAERIGSRWRLSRAGWNLFVKRSPHRRGLHRVQ